jgi:crotonobetainyl-CoA:carnitine CoA-transferase CaiB-like acyl-CoA transferase
MPVTAPMLGQHTADILAQHGYTEEEIDRLRGLGAVA